MIEIPEYQANRFELVDEEQEIRYLDKQCFRPTGLSPYKVRRIRDEKDKKNKIEVENTSYSGIIQLDSVRIHFSTKVQTNLFYMLSFLKDERNFCYDPEKIIEIHEGSSFFDILGRLFANELSEIARRGFCRRYVKRQENLLFLRGRMLIPHQLDNNLRKIPKFFCSYEDLTYDNIENRILLKATVLLIPLIRFNELIRRDLMRYATMLKEEVSLENLVPEDCDNVQYDRLNSYYHSAIQFSKIILTDRFIKSVHRGASRGFNFIVNMNQVYEDFVTQMVSEVVGEEERLQQYVVESQEKFDSLVVEKKVVTKPDILLRRKNTKEYPFIIDTKYKRQENNADYYQVIAYALAIPTAKACCLIYPSEEEVETSKLTVDTSPFEIAGGRGRQVEIFAVKINLYWDQAMDFKPYVRKVKTEIREKLLGMVVREA